jgi:hypothetical protein
MDSVAYPMATPEDLDETVNLVEKTGRRIVAEQGDVRDFGRLKAAWPTVWPSWAASTSSSPTQAFCRWSVSRLRMFQPS